MWPAELKKTKYRVALYEIFQESDRPLMVEEIVQLMQQKGHKVWLSTVYRLLISFQHYHLISKTTLLNDQAVYELVRDKHSHYAICMNCKKVIELEHCVVQHYSEQLQKHHFLVQGHKIEIYGLCQDCQH